MAKKVKAVKPPAEVKLSPAAYHKEENNGQ
jgi:hypothetical protein